MGYLQVRVLVASWYWMILPVSLAVNLFPVFIAEVSTAGSGCCFFVDFLVWLALVAGFLKVWRLIALLRQVPRCIAFKTHLGLVFVENQCFDPTNFYTPWDGFANGHSCNMSTSNDSWDMPTSKNVGSLPFSQVWRGTWSCQTVQENYWFLWRGSRVANPEQWHTLYLVHVHLLDWDDVHLCQAQLI